MRFYRTSCRLLIILSAAASLLACMGSQTSTVSNNPVAVPTELFFSPGDAQEIESNEQQSPPTSNTVNLVNELQQADSELNAGKYEIAQQRLAILSPLLVTSLGQADWLILQTKLALLTGNPKQAIAWLGKLPTSNTLNLSQQHYLAQLRIQALYRTNQTLLSAIATIENTPDNVLVWNELLSASPSELRIQQSQHSEPLIAGWLTLAEIAQNNANHYNALQQSLLLWQKSYPTHPANTLLSHIDTSITPSIEPSAIAVILPLTGNYADLGLTVQRGILSAYYQSHNSQQRLQFYDSNAESITTIYRHIQENGNDLILGPLTKEDTEDLLEIANESPKIISLNYTEKKTLNSALQFGLSQESEAQQIAQLAWRQGKSQAIIITPKTAKAEQTTAAFMSTWHALGGKIVDQYNYANNDDFSKSISTLLGAAESQYRQHNIHTTLQLRVTGNPYFRKDADMIFLVADPKVARQIKPFLKFYSGDYLTVFATSNIYSGAPNPAKDKDLNEIYFCDMSALFRNGIKEHNRLYFLGKDAYLLTKQQAHINTLPLFPLIGDTGNLTVNSTHDIQRELVCAQFTNGRPKPLNSTR